MTELIKSQQGKKNRRDGAAFERLVRADMESKGWTVSKWNNNVELKKEETEEEESRRLSFLSGAGEIFNYNSLNITRLIPAKSNRFNMRTCGFPDFVCFRLIPDVLVSTPDKFSLINHLYEVIGVEVKSNGYLDREEKEKCRWLLENNIFSKILIVSKEIFASIGTEKVKVEIKYSEFEK